MTCSNIFHTIIEREPEKAYYAACIFLISCLVCMIGMARDAIAGGEICECEGRLLCKFTQSVGKDRKVMKGIAHALTKEELADYKANGLISNNVEALSWRIKECVWNDAAKLKQLDEFLKTIGVQVSFIPEGFEYDSFFLTDFVLICCEGYDNDKNWHYQNSDPALSFVPLEYVEECEVRTNSYSKYTQAYIGTQKPSPVKGAVIGGVIGGATGAVIGATAAANSSGKAVYVPATEQKYRSVTMAIKIKDEELYEHRFANHLPDIVLSQKNLLTRELIRTASTATDMESKKKLLAEKEKSQKKTHSREKIGLSVFGVGIILIIILWIRLGFSAGIVPCLLGFSLLSFLAGKIMQS